MKYENAKPILFNTEMVRAILDGRKRATRRVMKSQRPTNGDFSGPDLYSECSIDKQGNLCEGREVYGIYSDDGEWGIISPYQPGDILWVRETWRDTGTLAAQYAYKADEKELILLGESGQLLTLKYLWHPSIHMPREAARLFLKVTDVRVERLQDIGDCTAEGVENGGHATAHMNDYDERCFFARLWNSTIKKQDIEKYGWVANPWVWVYEFEVMK